MFVFQQQEYKCLFIFKQGVVKCSRLWSPIGARCEPCKQSFKTAGAEPRPLGKTDQIFQGILTFFSANFRAQYLRNGLSELLEIRFAKGPDIGQCTHEISSNSDGNGAGRGV